MLKMTQENRLDVYISMVVVTLMSVGTVFVFSASANITTDIDLRRFYEYPALRQMLFFPLAVIVLFVASCFDYRRLNFEKGPLKSPVPWLLALSILLLALVLSQRFYPFVPSLVPRINQHYRWMKIPLGPVSVSFQPSELAKWCTVLFLAAFCARYSEHLRDFKRGFVPLCCLVGLVVGLIIIEDFGTAALVGLLAFLMLLAGGARPKHVLAPVPFALAAFVTAVVAWPARLQRITAFLHPDKWTDSANYQANQSLIALGSGGLFGKGLGMGICKYGHLPEDTTDFIFAIIGEELGFVGNAFVISLFIIFVLLGILVVRRCPDRFGRLLAAGITLAIGIQAAINIGVVTVVLPTKGIPLPFVSAGGTSLLLSAAAAGVLINIAKKSPKQAAPSTPPA